MFTAVRLSRALSLLICIAIVASISYWAGQLIAPKVAIAPSTIAGAPSDNFGGQANWSSQLFGSVPVAASTGPVAASTNMVVQGLLSGNRPAAVISVDGKPARPFGIGEEVQPGVKIKNISTAQVVVDRNGTDVVLPAPAKRTIDVLSSNLGKSAGAAAGGMPPPTAVSALPASPAASAPSSGSAPLPAFGAAAAPAPAPATAIAPTPPGVAPMGASNSPATDPAAVDPGKSAMRSKNRPEN